MSFVPIPCNIYTALSADFGKILTWDEVKHKYPWHHRAVVWLIFAVLKLFWANSPEAP